MGKIPEPAERKLMAETYFRQGYNCAQAVLLTFSDLLGADAETVLRAGTPLGGGMGRLREVCGAVSAMFMILGMLYGYETPETGTAKTVLYGRVQELAGNFEKRFGSIVCRELLGLPDGHDTPEASPRTEDFYQKRPCGEFIGAAAGILAAYIRDNPPEDRVDNPSNGSL